MPDAIEDTDDAWAAAVIVKHGRRHDRRDPFRLSWPDPPISF